MLRQAVTKRFRDGATAGASNSKMRSERLKMHTVRDKEIKRWATIIILKVSFQL